MNAKTRQRYLIIGVTILALLLIVALIFFGFRRLRNGQQPNGGGEVGEIVAATPTNTSTPFPTLTPTPTNTPVPTETPLPSPTPLPIPMTFQISGPQLIPDGLPRQFEWTIQATGGEGVATVIIDDLGGAMLTGDEGGNVIIARSVSDEISEDAVVKYQDTFVIQAILDPNVKSGVIGLEIRNNLFTEAVLIPWITTDNPDPTYQSFDLTLDGVLEEAEIVAIEPTAAAENEDELSGDEEDTTLASAAEPPQEGFQAFTSRNGITLNFPEEWFIIESQNGIIDISAEPIDPETISEPGEQIFATLITGELIDYGISNEEEISLTDIREFLLGKVIPRGSGEDEVLMTEAGLQITGENEMELPEGYLGSVTRLRTPDDFSDDEKNPFESIYVIVTNGSDVIIMNGYTLVDQPEQLDLMEQVAESLRFPEVTE